MKTQKFNVTGMTCAACQANVTRRVQKLEGVKDVDVNLLSGRMTVEYDESTLTAPAICAAVQEIGYGASDAEAPAQAAGGAMDHTNLMPLMNTPFAPGSCRQAARRLLLMGWLE